MVTTPSPWAEIADASRADATAKDRDPEPVAEPVNLEAVQRRLVVDAEIDELEYAVNSAGFARPSELTRRYERDLLHVLLWQDPEGTAHAAVAGLVDPVDFLVPEHAEVYRWRRKQVEVTGVADTALLVERMGDRGRRDLLDVVFAPDPPEGPAMAHRAVHYATQIRRRAVLRGLEALAFDRVRALRGAAVPALGLEESASPIEVYAAARAAEEQLLARLPAESMEGR
jgi:hypothetical protein